MLNGHLESKPGRSTPLWLLEKFLLPGSSIKPLPWLPSAMDSHSEVQNELNPSVFKLLFDHAIYDSGRKQTNANAARWMNWSLAGL